MNWSAMTITEKIEAIRPLADKGMSAGEIASVIGCSRNAVIGMWTRHRDAIFGPGGNAKRRTSAASRDTKPRSERPSAPEVFSPKASTTADPAPVPDGLPQKAEDQSAAPEPVLAADASPGPSIASCDAVCPDGVRLADLRPCHCRWIEGIPHGLDTVYCGRPRKSERSPYCDDHHARAFVKPPSKPPRRSGAALQSTEYRISKKPRGR